MTGANRGLGWEFARQVLERGGAVHAAARRPKSIDLPGARPVRLDLLDPASIAEAAATVPDITLLVNNAGIATATPLIDGDQAGDGDAIVDVMSTLSFRVFPGNGPCGEGAALRSVRSPGRAVPDRALRR